MGASVTMIDDVDLLQIALLAELASLDALDDRDPERNTLLSSALELVHQLVLTGGGTLGLEKLRAIRMSLEGELTPC